MPDHASCRPRLWCAALALALGLLAPAAPAFATAAKLSPTELAYVRAHPVVTMCVDPEWTPFERINERGEHEGIAADLLKLVAQRTGLRIQLVPTKTWEESVEASKSGRCEILSFLNSSPKREQWLAFTSPLLNDPNVFITREEHPFIAEPEALRGESIALPGDTYVEEKIRRDYPGITVLPTESEAQAVEMVSTRKADMTMRSLIVAAYTIRKEGLFNLKIAGQIPEYANRLRIGVVRTKPELLEVLEKGVQSVDPREREQIVNRHVAIEVKMRTDYVLILKIVLVFLLAGGVALYWTMRLRRLNAELRRVSQTDLLTGLFNRAKMDAQLRAEYDRASRYGRPLSVIMLDIDHFKAVNDELGHMMGDRMLTAIARTIQAGVRATDIAGRWGGEEFLVLCPETALAEAVLVAERIRAAVEGAEYPSGRRHTVSAGVAVLLPEDTADTLLMRVDTALYASKNGGRNQVRQA